VSYDARSLRTRKAVMPQHYLVQEPYPGPARNGATSPPSPVVNPLEPFRERFSILNGVVMTPSFDGHLQNMNFLFTGNPFGGDSFIPHLNLAETGRAPHSLDAILMSHQLDATITNHSGVVPLEPGSAAALSSTLRQIAPLEEGSELSDFVRGRLAANAAGSGRMAAGAAQMLAGLDRVPRVHRQLAQLTIRPGRGAGREHDALALVAECFRLAISRAAIYVLPEFFDVHAADRAKEQPKLFATAVGTIAALLHGLAAMPFDKQRSMFDVTTVMVASEFGRSLRSPDVRIDDTGTNHNQFSNSILLGGKGVRGGMVIGASDLAHAFDPASNAHLALDPALEKSMGRPFDFATMQARADLPDSFDLPDYLTVQSVVNTLYALFRVPKERHRVLRRDLPLAPVLSGLLA